MAKLIVVSHLLPFSTGKNNVHVLPKEGNDSIPGYLSLHQAAIGGFGCLKWSPNSLMNGSTIEDKSASWQQALNVDLNCIQFIHCHQAGEEATGTVVLIAIDGTQHPPIQFPPGGHLMQFLTRVESSLLPYGMLEPPLWSERKQKEEMRNKLACDTKEAEDNSMKRNEEEKTSGHENTEQNGVTAQDEEKTNGSPSTKKSKRLFPSFSLTRRKKEEKEISEQKEETAGKEMTSKENDDTSKPINRTDVNETSKKQLSVMDPIDTVFKIVNLAPIGGSCSNLNVPGQMQSSNGSLLNPETGGIKNQGPTLLSKSRTSEWFANLFSPSKSRNNSSSTDTSRSFNFSWSGEYPDDTNNKLDNADQEGFHGRNRSARTSGGGSGIADDEDEMIIMTTSSNGDTQNFNTHIRPKLRLFKQNELDRLDESSLPPDAEPDSLSRTQDTLSITPNISVTSPNVPKRKSPSEPISTMCSTMKRQIISRAFYGWLAHCRHMKTVRHHLSGLTFHEPESQPNQLWSIGLKEDYWKEYLEFVETQSDVKSNTRNKDLRQRSTSRNRPLTILTPATNVEAEDKLKPDEHEDGDNVCCEQVDNANKVDDNDESGINFNESEIYWRIYHGGIEASIRPQVWPYLFGHYKWDFSYKDRRDCDRKTQSNYENKLSDWMAIDAIVRQKDKEVTAANIAKLSRGASSTDKTTRNDMSSSVDEVFASVDDANTMSSRTVSQDKISTITEHTENSTSEEVKSRSKLSSVHSEGGGENINSSSSGSGKFHRKENIVRTSSDVYEKIKNSEKTGQNENIKSVLQTKDDSQMAKNEQIRPKSLSDRVASDEGIEDGPRDDAVFEGTREEKDNEKIEDEKDVKINGTADTACDSKDTESPSRHHLNGNTVNDHHDDILTSTQPTIQLSKNSFASSNGSICRNDQAKVEETKASGTSNARDTSEQNGQCERAVGYRITTPSVDSGHQSELSPIKPEDNDITNPVNVAKPTKESNSEMVSNGDIHEEANDSEKSLHSEEKDFFDTSNLSNYEGEIKKISHKIYTLTVNSDLKGNNLDADTHSSSSTGCISPMSSEGGIYPQELMDNFALNLHR